MQHFTASYLLLSRYGLCISAKANNTAGGYADWYFAALKNASSYGTCKLGKTYLARNNYRSTCANDFNAEGPDGSSMALTIGGRQVITMMCGHRTCSASHSCNKCLLRFVIKLSASTNTLHVLFVFSIDENGYAVNYTGLNATLAAGCVNAGCSIFAVPSNTTANQKNGVVAAVLAAWGEPYTPDWAVCQANPGNAYRIRYTDPRDAALSYAYDVCSNSGLAFDEAACTSARL